MQIKNWTDHIERNLFWLFPAKNGYRYHMRNSYIYGWESDFLVMSPSGYFYDIEVKVTKGDFKAEFKKNSANKVRRHEYLSSTKDIVVNPEMRKYKKSNGWSEEHVIKEYGRKRDEVAPNRFYFATPPQLVSLDDIPAYAGLLEIDEYGNMEKLKEAPMLHRTKQLDILKQKMLDKYYWSFMHNQNYLKESIGN